MKEKIYLIIWWMLLCLPLPAGAQDSGEVPRLEQTVRQRPRDRKALQRLVALCLNKADYDKAVVYGKRLLALSPQDGGTAEQDRAHALASLGQAYTMKGNAREAKGCLDAALRTGTALRDDAILCVAYNGLGLYSVNISQDYYQALAYYFKGIDSARRIHSEGMYTILLSNIVGVYYLQKDVSGLKYAQEVYALGHTRRKPFLTYMGATTLAATYSLKGDYAQALRYAAESERLMREHGFRDQASVYNIYGYIWLKKRDWQRAEEAFRKALSYQAQSQSSSVVDAWRGLAEAGAGKGDYRGAIRLLENALAISYREHNALFRGEMLERLSAFYEKTGDLKEALRCYKLYNRENARLFNAAKERAVNEMRAKYDVVRQESELRKNRLELLEKDRNQQLLLAGLCFIAVISALMYYLYRRKNKLYRIIVRQHRSAIRGEERMRARLAELEERLDGMAQEETPQKYSSSSLSEERKEVLFSELERLFREQSVYKDSLLTKKRVADLLGTNQSYLSQLINEQTGQTFTQYVNGYRIKEAVRLLSDPACDTPLKAISAELGFKSMTTFYNLFRSEIGMTPARYRKSAGNPVAE